MVKRKKLQAILFIGSAGLVAKAPGIFVIKIPFAKGSQKIAAAKEINRGCCAGAKGRVKGLRRASTQPERTSLQQVPNNMRRYDIGGLEVSYTEAHGTSLHFAELSITGGSGKIVRCCQQGTGCPQCLQPEKFASGFTGTAWDLRVSFSAFTKT